MINGNKIRNLREAQNLTTDEFGEAVGISKTMVSFIERGFKQPSLPVLGRIASYFKCTVDELLCESSMQPK